MVTPWVHWPVSWAEAATVSFGSGIRSLSPALSEVVFAELERERERLSDCSAEHDPGVAEGGDGAGVVPSWGWFEQGSLSLDNIRAFSKDKK